MLRVFAIFRVIEAERRSEHSVPPKSPHQPPWFDAGGVEIPTANG